MYARRPKPLPINTKTTYEQGAEARDNNTRECPYPPTSADAQRWQKGWNNRDFDIWFETTKKEQTDAVHS